MFHMLLFRCGNITELKSQSKSVKHIKGYSKDKCSLYFYADAYHEERFAASIRSHFGRKGFNKVASVNK